jgi:hypothetical protein
METIHLPDVQIDLKPLTAKAQIIEDKMIIHIELLLSTPLSPSNRKELMDWVTERMLMFSRK